MKTLFVKSTDSYVNKKTKKIYYIFMKMHFSCRKFLFYTTSSYKCVNMNSIFIQRQSVPLWHNKQDMINGVCENHFYDIDKIVLRNSSGNIYLSYVKI